MENEQSQSKNAVLPDQTIPMEIEVPIIGNPTKPDKKHIKGLRGRKKEMIISLVKNHGIIRLAAQEVGIHRDTHYDWLKNDPLYKKAYDGIYEEVNDIIEAALLSLIIDKNPQAVIHASKSRLRDRGYIEKQEIEHSGSIAPAVFHEVTKTVEEIKNERNNNKPKTEGNS